MATDAEREILTVGGREIAISNPRKVLFPQPAYTKLDLVHYYLAVADGALRAAGGRPNVLVRYPNGIDGEFFFQKRAPQSRPAWIEVVALRFPSGRTAEEVVPRDPAALAWMANLACLELHPHPVRDDDLDHPDELRIDLDPVPGITWAQIRDVARVVRATLDDYGLIGWPKTSGSRGMHVYVRIERRWTFDRGAPGRARAGARSRAARARPGDEQMVEGRAARRLSRLQPERERPHDCQRLLGAADRRRARLGAARPGTRWISAIPQDFTLGTMPSRFAEQGRPARGHGSASVFARARARAVGTPGARGTRRCAVAAALSQAVRRAGARAAVAAADVRSIR